METGGPDVKEMKRLANQKDLDQRKLRKEADADFHEHKKNLKRF